MKNSLKIAVLMFLALVIVGLVALSSSRSNNPAPKKKMAAGKTCDCSSMEKTKTSSVSDAQECPYMSTKASGKESGCCSGTEGHKVSGMTCPHEMKSGKTVGNDVSMPVMSDNSCCKSCKNKTVHNKMKTGKAGNHTVTQAEGTVYSQTLDIK